MRLTRTLPFALILCAATGGYGYAADGTEVAIEATVEVEYSITVSPDWLEFSGEDVDGASEKRIQITTTANTPAGVLVVTGCEGVGNNITLRKDSKADGPALPFTIRRSSANGDFKNHEWRIDTDFGRNGSDSDWTGIFLKPAKLAVTEAGNYACALTVKAQAK